MQDNLQLRPVQAGDEAFLRGVYASTRAAEIALTGWNASAADAFLRMQFDAQQRHYRQHYPQASYDIVLHDGVPAGRFWVARADHELRVLDIALQDAYRGQGIGTRLLCRLLDEAAASARPVIIHVEENNPAFSLYHRLGFLQTGTHGPYRLMEWRAQAAGSTNQETT